MNKKIFKIFGMLVSSFLVFSGHLYAGESGVSVTPAVGSLLACWAATEALQSSASAEIT